MKNLRSWMIFAILCALSVLAAHWLQSGTDARILTTLKAGLEWFEERIPSKKEDPDTVGASPLGPSTVSPELVAEGSNDNDWRSHGGNDHSVCQRPPTKARTEVTRKLVYKWTDADGQTHMADKPPQGQIASVVDLSSRKQDFTYDIHDDGAKLSLNFQGQLAAGAKRIYDTWHFFLGEEYLRQTHIKVRVIGGPARFDALWRQGNPNSKPVGGFYSAAKNEAFVKHNPKRSEQTIKTTFHEVSHLITAGHLGPTPPWLNEGLAEYFETMEVSGQGGTLTPNRLHLERLKRSRIPRLKDFLELNGSAWYGDQRSLNYALAWSLMHFLMEGAPGIYAVREVMQQARQNFCKPFSASLALHNAYPGGLSKLEADWRKWLARNAATPQQT